MVVRGGIRRGRQAGFTYLGLIIFVTIIGLVGAATLKIGALPSAQRSTATRPRRRKAPRPIRHRSRNC